MTHSAETQCLSGERERAEEKIPHIHFWLLPAVAEVLTAIALQRSCSCAAGGGTRTIDKGSLCHPLPGYPGAGDKPRAGGPGACAHPARGHTRAGPARGHPGAGRPGNQGLLPLYGEFLQEKSQQSILYFLTPDPVYILRCS